MRLLYICSNQFLIKMIKKGLLLLLNLFIFNSFSQSNSLWKGYFSYNQIKDISEGTDKLVCATENAIISKNLSTNELKTINSIDGLKAESISAIYYSPTQNKTFIGNQNGSLLILNADGTILLKNGIYSDLPVPQSQKRINHFLENQNKIYIATDYGITVFDLTALEFGDTFYIGFNGQIDKIFQTAILGNEIFAVTQNFGIKKALVSNPNLVDFAQWSTFDSGSNWNGITVIQNKIIATKNNTTFLYNGTSFSPLVSYGEPTLDVRTANDTVVITTPNNVYILNSSLITIAHITTSQITDAAVQFSCATVVNATVFIGTNENGFYSTSLLSPTTFVNNKPDGPIMNKIFQVKSISNTLWTVYGGYSANYNPYDYPNGLSLVPISKYTIENGWKTISKSSLFGAVALSSIAINPNNEQSVFVGSYFSGLLKLQNDVPSILYNATNTGTTGLQATPNNTAVDVRINSPVFDKNGNLWMTNAQVNSPIKVLLANGSWQTYTSTAISNIIFENYGPLAIDKNSTKWIPTVGNGLIGFNETLSNKVITIKADAFGNLPIDQVNCVAIDTKNQLWIGTFRGLRILSNVDSFLTETELKSKPIIILEDNLAQELFFDQNILDIAVDGANRKWVSLANAGVFLVSPNGQQTIYKFTKDNSPLPSNNVNDIEINNITGEVFLVTDKGMVSFKGTATKALDDLENVYVYPNPVRPDYYDTVKISGLTNKAVVKITDIEGNLVFETTSEGGTIEWDTTAFGSYKVASGVYMVLVSAQDGVETKVKKVMIIR